MALKENHQVKVVRISKIEKHPGADTLGLVHIGGYQAVVKLGDFKEGDLAYYIQPDSVVPVLDEFEFLWAGKVLPGEEVPLRYRRVKSRKFRGEWSEGLLMPLVLKMGGYTVPTKDGPHVVHEGGDIAELLGITHYDPDEERDKDQQRQRKQQFKRWPKSFKGWFYFVCFHLGINFNGVVHGYGNVKGPSNPPPVYDVDALKNYMNVFQAGERVRITEKIHGSNGRFLYQDGKMYVGSRKLWKDLKSDNIWVRTFHEHPEIEVWCKRNPGYTLYAEVGPTQKQKNGKWFDYGAAPGKTFYFACDILRPDGGWSIPYDISLSRVPVLYDGPWHEEGVVPATIDGKSAVAGATHIREGIVIRAVPERIARGTWHSRAQLKVVSNVFLSLT